MKLSSIADLAGTSLAAKFLRENGITLFKVRDEIVNLLGRSDMYFFSPEHPPLTEPAQKALDWAVEEKLKSGASSIFMYIVLHFLCNLSFSFQIMELLSYLFLFDEMKGFQ